MIYRFDRRRSAHVAGYVGKIVLLAALYVALARLALQLDPVHRFAAVVWPASGLSLAALLLFGSRLWPGIAIGAAVANVSNGAPIVVACGIAAGNTLEALLGAYALRRVPHFRVALDRVSDVLAFVGLAALGSTLVSATIGVLSLFAGGLVPGSGLLETWIAWWEGDAIGVLVVAPFVLTWVTGPWTRLGWRRAAEAGALGAALLGTSALLFGGDASAGGLAPLRQPVLLLPVLVWAALRFGMRGMTSATLLMSAIAVWSTALGRGPFVRAELHQSLAVLQAFMSVVAATFLVLSAVTVERERADRERTELYHRERLVRAHAAELERRRSAPLG